MHSISIEQAESVSGGIPPVAVAIGANCLMGAGTHMVAEGLRSLTSGNPPQANGPSILGAAVAGCAAGVLKSPTAGQAAAAAGAGAAVGGAIQGFMERGGGNPAISDSKLIIQLPVSQ
jgi:hypothetical protein